MLNVKVLPGRPYDGHTLAPVIPAIEAIIGIELKRIIADAGYRGGNAPQPYDLRVFTRGQKRRMTDAIKRTMQRRATIEPVIGDMKSELSGARHGRRHQRRAHSRRSQLPPHAQLDRTLDCVPSVHAPRATKTSSRVKTAFFTSDFQRWATDTQGPDATKAAAQERKIGVCKSRN